MLGMFLKRLLGFVLVVAVIAVICHSVLWAFITVNSNPAVNYFSLLLSPEYHAGRIVIASFGLMGGIFFLASSDLRKKEKKINPQ